VPFVLLLLVGVMTAHGPSRYAPAAWMLEDCGKSENEFGTDPRLAPFLLAALPADTLPAWGPANRAALTFIGGVPGDFVVERNRYVVASGCPAHACVARGMLWVDVPAGTTALVVTANERDNDDPATRQQYPIGSADLVIVTRADFAPARLPDALRLGAIVPWLHRQGVLRLGRITLLKPSGYSPVSADQLCWTGPCADVKW